MDMVRRKTTTRFHLLPWKKSGGSEMILSTRTIIKLMF